MFEVILMDFWHFFMHKCLSAERSCINIETEPRTYYCGGGGSSRGAEKYFGIGVEKIGCGMA